MNEANAGHCGRPARTAELREPSAEPARRLGTISAAPAPKGSKRSAKQPAQARKAGSEAGPREGSKKPHVLSFLTRATIDDLLSATGS